MKLHIRVQVTTINIKSFEFGYVIWHNWAKNVANVGVAVPCAPVGGWVLGPPQKFGHGNKFATSKTSFTLCAEGKTC